jgi:hypothetical protein
MAKSELKSTQSRASKSSTAVRNGAPTTLDRPQNGKRPQGETSASEKRPKKSKPKAKKPKLRERPKKERASRKKARPSARSSDRHDLYQQSVQCPEADIKFFTRVYKRTFGQAPTLLREDFCGTALLSCEWVKTRAGNRAIGVDLDPDVLAWGRAHNVDGLGDLKDRVELIEENVLTVKTEPVHVVASMNFSYFIFMDRPTMVRYFRSVREALDRQGIFVLDLMGGPEAQVVQEEEKELDGFTYVWDQHTFNPITHVCMNYIHFRFDDGTELKRSFAYEWRLWTIPEIRDMLHDAGFRGVDVYWEGADEDGEGNGVFRKSIRGDDSPAWIAYVVATP